MKRRIILLIMSLILIMQLTYAGTITWKTINLDDGEYYNSVSTPELVARDGQFAMFRIFGISNGYPNSVNCDTEFEQDYSKITGNLFIVIDRISKLGSSSPYKIDCIVDGSTISLYIGTSTDFCSTVGCHPNDECCPTNCYYPNDLDCPETKLNNSCDGVDIKIDSVCYAKLYDKIFFGVYNNAILDPIELEIITDYSDGSRGGLFLQNEKTGIKFETFPPFQYQATTYFSIKGKLKYEPNVVDGSTYIGNSLKSISIIPIDPTNPTQETYLAKRLEICINKEVYLNNITDCTTRELIWSSQNIEQTQNSKLPHSPIEQTQKKSSLLGNIIILKIFYIIVAFILLVILIFIIFKIIKITKEYNKKSPKVKPKKAEELKEIKEEEKKEKIPQSITTALLVSNFSVNHHGKDILNNVSFKIDRGKLVAIIGSSGAGKSTIIESLVGRKKPNSGNIKIFNKDIKEAIEHFGFVPQHMELYLNQTVSQNLESSATKYGIKITNSKIDEILNKLNLSHRKDVKANNLSGGQKKLLSLGMELIKDPELLILDEPTTGLDPSTRNQIITLLSSLTNHDGKTILLTTHFMDDCEECDEVIILHNKKIVAQDSPQKLEKRLPGLGKVVNIVLDNVTDDLLKKINKIESIEKVIREGRNLKILTNEPNAVKLSQKIDEIGGSILEAKLVSATMKEVFVYYTGEELDE